MIRKKHQYFETVNAIINAENSMCFSTYSPEEKNQVRLDWNKVHLVQNLHNNYPTFLCIKWLQ
jgi:hypothetical protein